MQDPARDTVNPPLTLVVGGTGKTGRRVAERLRARGVPMRSVSRSSDIRFDWDDPSTWDAALKDVSAAYVTYAPDLAVPKAPAAIAAFVRLAKQRGVRRLVLLSGRGEEEAQRCERIVLDTNPAWTVVRASWFDQNFSESFFLEPLQAGHLALPAGEVGEPFVDVDDIADVVVAALTEPGHEGQIYEVTGPRLLTFAQAVEEIAQATGRALHYQQVPVEGFVEGMRAHETPEPIIELTRYLFETVLDGRNANTADGVERALGRPPRDFSDYVREAAATGVWDVAIGDDQPSADAQAEGHSHEHIMRRFVDEVVNDGNMAVLSDVVHPDYVYRSPGEEIHGQEGVAALLGAYRGAFPDLRMEVDELLVADDATVTSFTLTGTHRGDLLGNPATGHPMKIHGMVRTRFRDGKIAEEWEILDQLTMFEQLGLVGSTS